ncbi:ubiquitin carboxyl-terminal hydrolase 43 isoform X2 [Rhipicephalus microplus]|uniref:ubiquitin carboxyl-terminal hydrolase 43 isoform X2 n=1 Tax=Rhipicephalus microplus TaxID=6941 RepID=UPI003F6A7D03
MHSSNSSPPTSRRRGQHPGSFFTIPRWMGGGGGSGSKKQLQYRSLRSLEDPTSSATAASATARRKRPSLFDQMVKRFFTPHVGHHRNGTSEATWNGGAKYSAPSRSGSLRDLRTRAVGGDPGGGDDTFFAGNGAKRRPEDAGPRTPVPAVAGIRNEGNTCFMNAVLQCLSNTDAFAEYLVSGSYRDDLGRARSRGGFASPTPPARVTEQLAQVLGALWSCRTEGDFAARFKSCVEKHGSQYQGSEQHDAQEFLIWLLDKVHEELLADDATATTSSSGSSTTSNAASRSRRGSLKRSKSRSSSVKVGGATPWQGSPVASLFAGQLRLRLTCPRCGQQSNTFDPFVCLSLPIPAASQWLCHVHFVPRNSPPTKLAFHMDFGAPVEQVRLRIAAECHIPPDQLLLLEETKEGFGSLFEGDEIASALSVNSRLVALELPPASTDPAVPKDSQILVFCRSRVGASGSCLGATRAAWVSREVSVLELKRKLLEGLPTSRQSAPKDQDLVNRLDVLVWDANQRLPADVDHPLFLEFVDCLLETSRDLAPAPILRVVLQWEPHVADRLFLAEDSIVDDVSTNQPEPEPSVSLSDCLAFYFTEEKLEPEEAWLCPQCDSRQQGFAQLGLWFCPEILVIHLKRFHQNGGRHSKLATRVEIPFQDLDLSNHLCKGASGSGSVLYDLYAFCSHHGTGLQGGHYTACCKNPVDEQWYLFDDARVRRALDEDLAARDAYLLFYRRQPVTTRRMRSSSPGHWFTRTPLPASRSHQHLSRGSPSRSASNPLVRGELTSPRALSPSDSFDTDAGALSPGSPPSLRDFSPPAGTTSFMDSSTSSDITPSLVENRSLTPSPGRALDFPTEKLNRISPPPKVSPKKSSPTRVTTRGSGFRPRPTYLSTSPTKGSPKKYSVSRSSASETSALRATSPITMTTKPWSGYNTVPAKSASDVDTSRTGRVALLAAKFSQPAGASAPSSKWPCKFPDVDDLEHTLPGRGSRGTCSPMNGDDDSFVSVNGAVYPSQTLNRSPVPLSPETLNRRVLSPRVTRSSRPVRNLNGSFDYEQVIQSPTDLNNSMWL